MGVQVWYMDSRVTYVGICGIEEIPSLRDRGMGQWERTPQLSRNLDYTSPREKPHHYHHLIHTAQLHQEMADNNNNEEAGAAAPQEPQARVVLYCGGKIFDWQFFFGSLPPTP